jgi:hypothetical protein
LSNAREKKKNRSEHSYLEFGAAMINGFMSSSFQERRIANLCKLPSSVSESCDGSLQIQEHVIIVISTVLVIREPFELGGEVNDREDREKHCVFLPTDGIKTEQNDV